MKIDLECLKNLIVIAIIVLFSFSIASITDLFVITDSEWLSKAKKKTGNSGFCWIY